MESVKEHIAALEARIVALEAKVGLASPPAKKEKAPRKPNLAAQLNAAWTKNAMSKHSSQYDPFVAALSAADKTDKNGKPKPLMVLHNNFAKAMKEAHASDYDAFVSSWKAEHAAPAEEEEAAASSAAESAAEEAAPADKKPRGRKPKAAPAASASPAASIAPAASAVSEALAVTSDEEPVKVPATGGRPPVTKKATVTKKHKE